MNSEDNWPIKRIGLRVSRLESEVEFYTRLGLKLLSKEPGIAHLGVGGKELLQLRELKEGITRPVHSAGLYHFALLLPDDAALASFLQHAIDEHIQLEGASDHLVSQAIYLQDPEGNGIEIYADRPREQWVWTDAETPKLKMGSVAMNIPALLAQAEEFDGFAPGTKLGHIHLNVSNLERSAELYKDIGLDIVMDIPNSAKFLSWDGYHHHLGINVWRGEGVPGPADNTYGIDFWEITKSDLRAEEFTDLDNIKIRVV